MVLAYRTGTLYNYSDTQSVQNEKKIKNEYDGEKTIV